MMLSQPVGNSARPSPALIYTVYLWGIRLSDDPAVKKYEPAYLHRATQDAATALSGSHPHRIMHSLQAEVLLSAYFFACGRFFEGKYHVATAVSTLFSAGLHKIRAVSAMAPSLSSSGRLEPPRDSMDEAQRILCCWTALILDKSWAIALDHSPNFEYSTHPVSAKIDTPWPLELEDVEQASRHTYSANRSSYGVFRALPYLPKCAPRIPFKISSKVDFRMITVFRHGPFRPRPRFCGSERSSLHARSAEVGPILLEFQILPPLTKKALHPLNPH